MLKIKSTVCIEAPKTKCWAVLSDIENIPQWSKAGTSAKCLAKNNIGVGVERQCDLTNNITIREKWVDWHEGESYTYLGFGLPLVKSARNKWPLVEEAGKTYLTTEAEVVIKGGLSGRLLEPLMKLASKKMVENALAALKYLIETGRPFEGKHSDLPRPLAIC